MLARLSNKTQSQTTTLTVKNLPIIRLTSLKEFILTFRQPVYTGIRNRILD